MSLSANSVLAERHCGLKLYIAAQLIIRWYMGQCIINVREQHESVCSGPLGYLAQTAQSLLMRNMDRAGVGRKLKPVSVGIARVLRPHIDLWESSETSENPSVKPVRSDSFPAAPGCQYVQGKAPWTTRIHSPKASFHTSQNSNNPHLTRMITTCSVILTDRCIDLGLFITPP